MKKEIANLWVQALRSGNYKSGTLLLRSIDNHFCPIGVLCDLAVTHKNVNREMDKTSFLYDGHREAAPPKVMEWSGLKNPNGFCPQVGKSITELTDKGANFEHIASVIEREWLNL